MPTDRTRAAPPRLLAISASLSIADDLFERWLRRLAEAGVDGVQLRDRGIDDLRLFHLARRARALLPARCRLLVNRRVDVAVAAGADGVHLPADGLPIAPLRRRFGDRLLIGRSTHHPEEVAAARRDGADYATFGPVFPTPSKESYGPPPGLAGLQRATAAAPGFPVLALGGLTADRLSALGEVAAAGAAGVAGIRAFADSAAPPELAELARRAAECFRVPRRDMISPPRAGGGEE